MFLQRMDDRVSVTRPWFPDYGFYLVDSVEKLSRLVDMCIKTGIYSLDLETSGVDNRVYPDEFFADGIVTRHGMRTVDRIVGCCISFDGKNGYYVPLSHEPEDSNNLPWDPAWDELERLVHSGKRAIFHNKKFDAEFLYPVTNKEYWNKEEYEDTFLLFRTHMPLKSSPAGLKHLSKHYFTVEMVELDELFTLERKEQLKREKRGYNFGMLHPKEGLEYGSSDGIFTFKLFHVLEPKLSENDKHIYMIEKAFCNVLRKMERNRVHIDVERVTSLYEECKHELETVGDIIRSVIEAHSGKTGKWMTLKVGSPKQLSVCFFNDPEGIRLKPTKKMIEAEAEAQAFKGQQDALSEGDEDGEEGEEKEGDKVWSLKDEALKSLHEDYGKKFSIQRPGVVDKDGKPKPESIFELIIEWRHYDKMKGSFIEKLFQSHDKYGDVRPNFNQIGADTTRMSSTAGKIDYGYSGINFQGIPRDSDDDKPDLFKQIRTCIIPRPGWMLVKLDYAGEELRVVTNLSGDRIWSNSFLNEDGDVHAITARTLFAKDVVSKDERNRGKRSNFAFIYGGGAGAIQRNVDGYGGMKCSMEDAQRHMDNLKRDVPELMGYVEHQKAFARKHKCIYTAFGRKIPIPTIDSPIKGIRRKAERCAINYTIQATSADVLKIAMCFVDKNIRALGWQDRCKYVLTVHDEIVFEILPQYMAEIIPKLDEWMTFPWKLPKAHGREWIVPLMTEPGIDMNWKARYDFFAMVDGIVPQPKEMKDGEFVGKLKKDQYFKNGRVYQMVPDFLQEWIKPKDRSEVAVGAPAGAGDAPRLAEAPKPVRAETKVVETSIVIDTPAEPTVAATFEPETDASTTEPEKMIDFDIEMDFNKSKSKSEPPAAPTVVSETPVAQAVQQGVVAEPAPALPSTPAVQEAKEPPPAPVVQAPKDELTSTGVKVGESIHRWTFNGVPCEYSQRKLQAILILSEGPVALRIVNPKGEIMVSEGDGVRVNPAEFDLLTRLFGLLGQT